MNESQSANHIVLACDDNYCIPCLSTIASLLSHTNPQTCDIHILTTGLNSKSIKALGQLQSLFPLAAINVNKITEEGLLKDAIVSKRFPIANFFRLLIPQIFDYDKVLYLDCDIIVNDDIQHIFDIDITNYACAMVIDQNCDDITLHNRIEKYDTDYFNAGVLLMNLDYWRKENITDKLMNFMHNNPARCLYPDQDAINVLLGNKIFQLPCKYNVQELWYRPQDKWIVHHDKWQEITEALAHPTIIHFTGKNKPWSKRCIHPLAYLYQYYKNIVMGKGTVDLTSAEIKKHNPTEYFKNESHRHIRRANLFMALFIGESILLSIYAIWAFLS